MTHYPHPPCLAIGISPEVDTLTVLAGTIQELRSSIPPRRGEQGVTGRSWSVRKLPWKATLAPTPAPVAPVWTEHLCPKSPLP